MSMLALDQDLTITWNLIDQVFKLCKSSNNNCKSVDFDIRKLKVNYPTSQSKILKRLNSHTISSYP